MSGDRQPINPIDPSVLLQLQQEAQLLALFMQNPGSFTNLIHSLTAQHQQINILTQLINQQNQTLKKQNELLQADEKRRLQQLTRQTEYQEELLAKKDIEINNLKQLLEKKAFFDSRSNTPSATSPQKRDSSQKRSATPPVPTFDAPSATTTQSSTHSTSARRKQHG